jgi:cobalt-precorrin 5A hydrolase/precorrin-3B C17-methyltransferase
MRVVAVSVTEAGRALAERLPYERCHGSLKETAQRLWHEVDAFVLMAATGAALRVIAPLLSTKAADPGIVCVDEAGRFAVALCGGHAGGANDLAREVAGLLGAEPVVTTATDATGMPALDNLPGFVATGDVSKLSAAYLEGRNPQVEVALAGWSPPAALCQGEGPGRVVVTDAAGPPGAGSVYLHPPSLVAGIGCASEATSEEVASLLEGALAKAGLARESLGLIATIDRRRSHPALVGLGLPVRAFGAQELAAVPVPNPSAQVAASVGTPSVAEAAALLAAGEGARLVASKQRSATATVAIARRSGPMGKLSVVGLGPGSVAHRTLAATVAVRSAEVVIGYGPYIDQAADLLGSGHVIERSPIGEEVGRARRALELARSGRRVALVCSGDPGVFAMASIVLELACSNAPEIEIEVVPGVSAGLAASSLLGAPLGHDHAFVSLSDLLTPWEVIERRLHALGAADLVVVLYNPRSRARTWQLTAALEVLGAYRPPTTPVGIVTDAARDGERTEVTTLGEVDVTRVSMTSCVIVGATTTKRCGTRIVTPRGYRP